MKIFFYIAMFTTLSMSNASFQNFGKTFFTWRALVSGKMLRFKVAMIPADDVVQRAKEEPAHEEAQGEEGESEWPTEMGFGELFVK